MIEKDPLAHYPPPVLLSLCFLLPVALILSSKASGAHTHAVTYNPWKILYLVDVTISRITPIAS